MIKPIADWLVYGVLKMRQGGIFPEALDFFFYETAKIFLLLAVIIFAVAVIRTFFSPERTRAILSHKQGYGANVLAALLGIVTPFCSCSAVPLFLGFLNSGVPLGVTFSFLVASPMINEVALVMLWGLFGWKLSLIYIGSGLVIAVVSGVIIGRLKAEKLVELAGDIKKSCYVRPTGMAFKDRVNYARDYTASLLKSIWLFVVIGIGLGAWIHGYVPADFLARYAGRANWFAVPLATLIGIPLYSNAAGIIPMVSALTEKGVAIGTALSFMMAVTALSLPEFIILRKAMKLKLLLIFALVVGAGIIFTGYLFNLILR
ncbi:MAG: permease [Candidatus Omnitrophota bacterium]